MGNKSRLKKSLLKGRLVRLSFKSKHMDACNGFVVGLGKDWVLLAATMDGGYFDGYQAFRQRDIRRVRWDTSFESRFARTQPEWPPTSPPVDLSCTSDLITSLAGSFPLVMIERTDAHGCGWVGRPLHVGRKRIVLQEVRPNGTWDDEPGVHGARVIFCVQVANHYLTALNEVADPRPEVAMASTE